MHLFGKLITWLIALTAGLATSALADEPPPVRAAPQVRVPPGTEVLRDVAYVPGGHPRQVLDLYLPAEGRKLPLIIWIHGGAWEGGSKENPPAVGFLWVGPWAVASIGYRLSSHQRFPAQIEDCKAAVRFLRAHADEYRLDPERFGVWGHSAGGHLAALLGTSGETKEFDKGPNKDVSSRVQAVCDFSGPSDLLLFADSAEPNAVTRLLGESIRDHREVARQASPIAHVTSKAPPFLIVHGDQDTIVPVRHGESLAEALEKQKVDVTLHIVRGAGHNPHEEGMNERIGEFFARTLHGTVLKQGERRNENDRPRPATDGQGPPREQALPREPAPAPSESRADPRRDPRSAMDREPKPEARTTRVPPDSPTTSRADGTNRSDSRVAGRDDRQPPRDQRTPASRETGPRESRKGQPPPANGDPQRLTDLSDEFTSPQSLARWQRIYKDERAGADPLERLAVEDAGWLVMMPYASVWYQQYIGELMYKPVRGDFVVSTRVRVSNRAGRGPPQSQFSLAGIMVRVPHATARSGNGEGENYVFLSLGAADKPGAFQCEVKSTVRGNSDLAITPASSGEAEIRVARSGPNLLLMIKPEGKSWTVHRRYSRPDFPDELQVGLTCYTDWPTCQRIPVAQHNRTVIKQGQPDLIARFDYVRFDRLQVRERLANQPLSDPRAVPDAQILSFLGDSE